MSTSRIPAILAAWRAIGEANGLEVMQGMPGTDADDAPESGLYVAATDETNQITFEQSWAGQGSRSRNESFEIPNLLYRWTGDTDQDTVISEFEALFTTLGLLEDAVRLDPTLGVSGYTVRAQFGTDGSASQTQTTDGLTSRVRFTLAVETRI